MLEKIAATLRDECAVDPDSLIIIGVSGGPDSLCLMHVLHALRYRIVVAHFDHRLRPESAVEARDVGATAAALGVPFVVGDADVRLQAQTGGYSIEEAARHLRYGFLFGEARLQGAQAVAVGHTADDQVETVLMHIIRGAGPNGLQGMSYRTVLPDFDASRPLIRPLLAVWRREVEAYCASHLLKPQHDRSNESREFLRNRIRHELIPQLQSYNPRIRDAVWRLSQAVSSDYSMLAEEVAAAWGRFVTKETKDFVAFDSARLAECTIGFQKQLVRFAARRLAQDSETTFAALSRAARFIGDASRMREDLSGGMSMVREGGVVYLTLGAERLPSDSWPQMPAGIDSIQISVPGCVKLTAPWKFSSEGGVPPSPMRDADNPFRDESKACLDSELLKGPLQLRKPRPGDRFQPLGMQGRSQKLSDFFVNAKLPARARGRWPLLCAGETVIWVPGFRPAENFRLRPTTRQAVCFAVSRDD